MSSNVEESQVADIAESQVEAPMEVDTVEDTQEDVEQTVEQYEEESALKSVEKRRSSLEPHVAYIGDKVTHVEDRLMRSQIKLHEAVRQMNILVEVFDNKGTDPNWFFSKLSHELQAFVEAFWG